MGRTPPRLGVAEDKGNGLSLRVALRVIPWNRKSTKTEKDNGKNRNIYGKAAIIAFSTLYLTEPYFFAFITTPNNFGDGLIGQISVL